VVELPLTLLLVVALPFAAAIILALSPFLGRRLGRSAGAILTAALALSFGAAVAIAQAFVAGKTSLVAEFGAWLPLRGSDLALRIDTPMVPVLVGLTAVATLIALASLATREEGTDPARFGVAFGLTVGALLLVVTARDLLLLFAGWELLAAGTYLLVADRRDRPAAATAALRSFVVARVGDTALLVAVLWYFATFRSVDIGELAQRIDGFGTQPDAVARLQAALLVPSLLVLVAALARSAQLPFQVWLPDAARTGTASSALIQSSVAAAGVLLLVRLAPVLNGNALAAAAAIGAITALFAASAALAQSDRRQLVAWSTVSQIGLMFVGAGAGSASFAITQLLAHAFGKSAVLLGERVRGPSVGALALAAGALAIAIIAPPILVPVALPVLLTGAYTARLLSLSAAPRHDRTEGGALALGATVVLAVTALVLAVLTAGGSPWVPLLALAGLAIGVALARGAVRIPVAPWLVAAARSGFAFDGLYRASVVAAFEAVARSLERGTERVVEWAGDEIAFVIGRGARQLDRAQRRYARAGEAVVIAAALALAAFWTLR
jgi:NADH:ubiquinone oxidoreductase subunit 5 (subunit L)/multisubunit Na+/H+ antiporter MnhA subunit